jgi:outer membrane protein assembly factor BamB
VIIVAVQLVAMFGPPLVLYLRGEPAVDANGVVVEEFLFDNPQVVLISKALGPLAGTLLLLLWWVGFSRASWRSRIIGPAVVAGIGWVSLKLMHWTMGIGFVLYALPTATASGLLALFLFREIHFKRRGVIALAAVAIAFGTWTLVRMDGVDGYLSAQLSWRWSKTAEEKLLAGRKDGGSGESGSAGVGILDPVWPEFRGPGRDGRITGTVIRTDWPEDGLPELWRIPVGPGWSSFAVAGDRLFTQEQRGDLEVVVAYDAASGREVWKHEDETRFKEFISGVGPRATPTFAEGRLYTTGANGTVNCLDPRTGDLFWTRNLGEDTGAAIPMWGFSSSPLVHDGRVMIFSGAGKDKSLIAYSARDGNIEWMAGNGYLSYSSAHLTRLHGVTQVLVMTEIGLASFDPETGEELWLHDWPLGGGSARIIQPAAIGNDVLIGTGYGYGTRRISVDFQNGAWSTTELWTSRALKPSHNDFVVDGNHAFGFDASIFTCVDLETGKRLWKRGRYGAGQVLLLADQKLLVVLSEKGELVLLAADPSEHTELHRFQAVEGKTWNHPVIADGRLYVRNGTEAASFDLSPSDSAQASR